MTRIYPASRSLRVSRLGPPNPLPQFRLERRAAAAVQPHPSLSSDETAGIFAWGSHPILPYLLQDDYDRSQAAGELPAIFVENDALRLTVYPTLGGRLASLYDRQTGREVLFDNPVFQPANLAVLNAWFSGGVEWNGIIPGHSPFTCAPVFAGLVQTDRGALLRLYEFERIREAVWQVDLYLPRDDGCVWVHGRLLNPNPYPIRAYWWTNSAVPLLPGTRVLAAADYCIEHVAPDNHLEALPFPAAHGFDGSYPEHYGYAASVFFRPQLGTPLRPWLVALRQDGYGLLHVSTPSLPGRKMFVFGQHAGGRRWMDFLSLPGQGAYIEVQAGALPTQDQEFIIAPGAAYEWTECLTPFAADPAIVHDPDFDAARHAIDALAQAAITQDSLHAMDAWLHAQVDAPITQMLHTGEPWGDLHERLTGQRISAGLSWSLPRLPESVRPWHELLEDGRFSAATLAEAPRTWAVSPRWMDRLAASREAHGTTWLHELCLGVAWLNEGEVAVARSHFTASLREHDNFHAQRGLALIAYHVDGDVEAATAHYLAAWELSTTQPDSPDDRALHEAKTSVPRDPFIPWLHPAGSATALAVEICRFFQQTGQSEELEGFLARLPDAIRVHERIALARGQVALQHGDLDVLRQVLDREFATVREGEALLTELWFGLQIAEAEAELGRPLNEAERAAVSAAHPMPYHLDFRMVK